MVYARATRPKGRIGVCLCSGLDVQIPEADAAATAGALAQAEPITEEKKIIAKYRVTKKEGDSRMSFAPVQRVHQLDTGELTELGDIHFNLNDKLRQDFVA